MAVQSIAPVGHVARPDRPESILRRITDAQNPTSHIGSMTQVDEPLLRESADIDEQAIPEIPDTDQGKASGVIRLLEAGHFRGVADVRLRINFFDELSARAQAAAQPITQEQTVQLVDAVKSGVEEIIASLVTDQETNDALKNLSVDFDLAVESAVQQAMAGQPIDGSSLESSLQAAFGTLVQQVRDEFAARAEEPPVPADEDAEIVATGESGLTQRVGATTNTELTTQDPQEVVGAASFGSPGLEDVDFLNTEPVDPASFPSRGLDPAQADNPENVQIVEQSSETLDEAIASLTQAFQEALVVLIDSIQSTVTLSDPSPPTGNGVAYQNFLAIYNDLRGINSGMDQLV